jgi:hypothetical protein
MTRSLVAALFLVVGCTATNTDLATNQGPCTNLDLASCRLDGRCQQAYINSAFSGTGAMGSPFHCLQLDGVSAAVTACSALDRDGCRARADCSPLFWQDLGPTDGPVGDPYFKSCLPELSP